MDEFKLRSECAAQAEKVRAESRFSGGGQLQQMVLQSDAHYNSELNRCFVHFKFLDMVPTHAEVLADAYENTTIISCVGHSNQRSCLIHGEPIKPDEADKRIKDYMEH